MSNLRKAVYFLLCVVTVVVMSASVLSVFRDTPSNYLKMLDFPRIQLFLTSFVTLILFAVMTRHWRWYDYCLIAGLLGGLVIHGVYLVNYTPLSAESVPAAEVNNDPADRVSLVLANVLMTNRDASKVIDAVRDKNPDFFLAMEVDDWWVGQLSAIEKDYPYAEKHPNDVAYGMAIYSKLPLESVEINELNNDDVPSFEAVVKMRNGRQIMLHAVHPVPPKNFTKYPDNQGQQEVAMAKVGRSVENSSLPNIVAGDFNDVVWGYTNLLTDTEDLLFDVRVGRGFYNSFDVTNWLMRWPLDHVFVTKEFSLHRLERMGDVGSDHFPIYVELVLEGN